MTRRIFVTTALPYANGPFHIGHIMEYIQADIWVRFQRMQGHELHFVCADDAHGAPIMLKAEAEGITPQQLIARIAAGRPRYLQGFHLSFDHWHSTDSPENTQLSQDVYARLKAAGLIYAQDRRAVLRPGQGHVPAGPLHQGRVPQLPFARISTAMRARCAARCMHRPISSTRTRRSTGAKPLLKSSEHFFFRLSDPRCVAFLKEWLDCPREAAAAGRQQGARVAHRALARRRWPTGTSRAMRPTSASRSRTRPGKYFYVWLDAPIGYLAALKSYFESGKARANGERRSFAEFLAAPDTEQIHFIGKDIIYFHTLFWPAMLKFAGPPYKVPDHVYVHGFITVSGEKMSKSRGTGISPLRYLEIGMDAEWLRYYIAAKLNASVEDIDFNPDDFLARVNSDLIGKYVNIASRAANFITRHFGGELKYQRRHRAARRRCSQRTQFAVQESYENREFGKAHARHHGARRPHQPATSMPASPGYSRATRRKAAELQDVCSRALHGFKLLSVLLAPVLPEVAERVARQLFGLDRPFRWSDAAVLPERINPYQHLMKRVEPRAARCAVRRRRRAGAPAPAALLQAAPPPAAAATDDGDRRRRRPAAAPPRSRSRSSGRSTCAWRGSSTPRPSPVPTSC